MPFFSLFKKNTSYFLGWLLFFFITAPVYTEVFKYKFSEGDSYRINSLVNEDVFVDKEFSHHATITNRITVSVSDIKEATNTSPASALYSCTFMSSERNADESFSWGREYSTLFRRDEMGIYTIEPQYFKPMVRNMPVFPKHDVKKGETWVYTAEEAHDLRDVFGIEKPFIVPFSVTYTYEDIIVKEGKKYHKILAEYDLFYEVPKDMVQQDAKVEYYPIRTMGYSKQELLWDNEEGILPYYSEEFKINLELNTGSIIEYEGSATGQVTEMKKIAKNVVDDLNDTIQKLGIKNTEVRVTEAGVTIVIEKIQFEPDSARLRVTEKEKIKKIGKILKAYPNYELLISGHTALAGTEKARQKLSEDRAAAVARQLIKNGVRAEHHIFTRGFGARIPLVPNTTEENRSRNRRVEITILEK